MAVYNKLEKMEGECMEKRLEDRSLEELWQLFPIFLVPYKKKMGRLVQGRKRSFGCFAGCRADKARQPYRKYGCFRYLGQKYHRYPVRSTG